MNNKRIITLLVVMFVLSIACKDKNNVETGTEFPEEFLGVWEADHENDPEFEDDDGGIFVHFESDTVTYYGRIGEIENPTCYYTAPIYEIIKYEGNRFTLNILGLDEKAIGELTIKVNRDVMEWVFSRNDTDRWNRTEEDASTFEPDCGIDLNSKSLSKFKNLRKW